MKLHLIPGANKIAGDGGRQGWGQALEVVEQVDRRVGWFGLGDDVQNGVDGGRGQGGGGGDDNGLGHNL